MTTMIVDYESGNLRSAEKSFQRVAGTEAVRVISDPAQLAQADRIVLPGVGAFADCARGVAPFRAMLGKRVIEDGVPFLGICVGMQLLADVGREHEEAAGFGWIGGDVVRLEPGDSALKVPHMGWNALETSGHALFEGVENGAHVYFVHSYHLRAAQADDVVATARHGQRITAAVARGNIAGVQFHPEKSQEAGLRLIANFLRWRP